MKGESRGPTISCSNTHSPAAKEIEGRRENTEQICLTLWEELQQSTCKAVAGFVQDVKNHFLCVHTEALYGGILVRQYAI